MDVVTKDELVAKQLLAEYLAWSEKKDEEDQKQLRSILKAWGAK
jgi:hypothetical protein